MIYRPEKELENSSPPSNRVKYLKLEELKEGEYYKCRQSGRKVLILGVTNIIDNDVSVIGMVYNTTTGGYQNIVIENNMLSEL